MAITTRLTQRLGIRHPIISAPMALAAGGALAAAVSHAGGLGLIGGGYGNHDWLETEFRAAGNARIGCGFITWSMAKDPTLLDSALAHKPRAVFLSFGDPIPFGKRIEAAGAMLICQVQSLADVDAALSAGAEIIVAQGSEAGGHGAKRATLPFVPEVADYLARHAPDTLLCAAGGVADGRGLAAALMLGADGVVVGSRLWASTEALVHPNAHQAAMTATGDDTVRQSVTDIARRLDWPSRFDIRTLRNAYLDQWHGRETQLRGNIDVESERYATAYRQGDTSVAPAIVGEITGLIATIEPAGTIVERMVTQAEQLLSRGPNLLPHASASHRN